MADSSDPHTHPGYHTVSPIVKQASTNFNQTNSTVTTICFQYISMMRNHHSAGGGADRTPHVRGGQNNATLNTCGFGKVQGPDF